MELLKNLFSEGEALTYDQLTEKINAAGMKLANIADGSYVSRDKMDSKVKGLQGQITDLQAQVKQRDTDMADLQTKLTAAQTDADKLASVQSDLAALRKQREDDGKAWAQKIAAQAYEFAVREKAGEVKFSSNAAKKQFIADAIAKQFKQDENGKVQGYDEFLTQYKADDPGSFVSDDPAPAPAPKPNAPSITVPAKPDGNAHKMSLSEQMAAANADPNFVPDFS